MTARFVLPGGVRRWITLASAGFLVAALLGHGRQLLALRDGNLPASILDDA